MLLQGTAGGGEAAKCLPGRGDMRTRGQAEAGGGCDQVGRKHITHTMGMGVQDGTWSGRTCSPPASVVAELLIAPALLHLTPYPV